MAHAIPDAVLEALDRAPFAVDDLDDEEVAEIRRRAADITSGRVQSVEHGDVQRTIDGMRKLAG
jgi:flavin-binding protein dodecin